jgi:hypothetical protein
LSTQNPAIPQRVEPEAPEHPGQPAPAGSNGDGLFEWQMPQGPHDPASWNSYTFDTNKWWGTFPRTELAAVQGRQHDDLLFTQHPWAIGPFRKHRRNPVLAPSPERWDSGRYNGGVHNGAIVRHAGRFHYVYRGERPIDVTLNTTSVTSAWPPATTA